MDNHKITDQLMDKYVRGDITAKEKETLIELVNEKPELNNEIGIRLDIARSMGLIGNKQLRSKINKIHEEEYQYLTKSKSSFSTLTKGLIAIAIIALIILGLIVNNKVFSKVDNTQLFAAHYKPYHASFHTRGVDKGELIAFKEAYTNQQYENALNVIPDDFTTDDSELLLAAGISAIEMGNGEKARAFFQEIIMREDYFYISHAQWYTAMSYIKDNNTKAASPYLQSIAQDEKANHHKEAKTLFSMIN